MGHPVIFFIYSPISSFVRFNSKIIFFKISLLGKAFSLSILTYCLKEIPKRSQIKEWLSLNLMEVQTTNYDKTDSEILEIARGKAEKSEELKKLGKTVLVICESMHSYAQYTIWTDILKILDGNATSTKNFPVGLLIFKVKEKAKMTAISFYTNITWSTSYTDGLRIYKYYDGYEISTQPVQ